MTDKRLTWVAGDRPDSELDDVSRKNLAAQPQSGTSIFDPVLCELVYRWFCPPGGSVLDPFAGGSVRGIVAAKCGLHYTGIELRHEQVAENEKQAAETGSDARWLCGDSINADTIAPGAYDLVFSCPPYYDLERYSDDIGELSAMPTYEEFVAAYRTIVAKCCAMLKPDRFACFVVGDIRDKRGFYRGLPCDTVRAFVDAGAGFYNDAVLVTPGGSLPIRVGKQFSSGRKLGKTHQNVLVFFKGDPSTIKGVFGNVEFGSTDEAQP